MKIQEYIAMVIGGGLFGFGLAYSGAAVPEVVLSFLRLEDLGLLFVIGLGLVVTAIIFNLIPKLMKRAVFGSNFSAKDSLPVTKRTVVGAAIFGIGWGLTGLCPGTAFAGVGMGNWPILYGVAGMFLGALVYGLIRSRR